MAWPGRDLIAPLQQIWADGKVTTRELHRLSRILVSIQREWAKSVRHTTAHSSPESSFEISYDETGEPRLPTIRTELKIASRSTPNLYYKVDLVGPTCSCPDWHGRRSRLPVGHLTRCCKHVFDAYAQLPPTVSLAPWMEAFLELAWPAAPNTEWGLMSVGADQILYSSADSRGWANCFAKEGAIYARFGYNTPDRRWAYGSQPSLPWAVAEAIASLDSVADAPRTVSEQSRGARQHSSRTPAVIAGAIAVVLLAAVIISVKQLQRPEPAALTSVSPPPTVSDQGPNLRRVTSTNTKIGMQQPTSQSWIATATRPIRVKAGAHEIVIPAKERLHVIGRGSTDLMISYQGQTFTIPASATDLR